MVRLSLVAIAAACTAPVAALQATSVADVEPAQVGTYAKNCWKLCNNNEDGVVSKLHTNNLGGAGPNHGAYEGAPEILRYNHVLKVDGNEYSLIVKVNHDSGPYTPYNASMNGQHKCFGVINVASESKVTLDFQFVKHGTDEPLGTTPIGFTILDIDHSNKAGNLERITFDTPLAGPPTFGEQLSAEAGARTVLTSNAFGAGSDNPLDANPEWAPLPQSVQMDTAAEVMYWGGEWTVTLEVVGGSRGRNFLFYGCEDEGKVLSDGAVKVKTKRHGNATHHKHNRTNGTWHGNKSKKAWQSGGSDVPPLPSAAVPVAALTATTLFATFVGLM